MHNDMQLLHAAENLILWALAHQMWRLAGSAGGVQEH